jgi:hypothetical protein
MSIREDYRQFACDCLRLADKAEDRAEREILLEMADAWTVIALQAPLLIEHTPDRDVLNSSTVQGGGKRRGVNCSIPLPPASPQARWDSSP